MVSVCLSHRPTVAETAGLLQRGWGWQIWTDSCQHRVPSIDQYLSHRPAAGSTMLRADSLLNDNHYHHYWGTHTHTFNGPFPGLPRWASTRKVKPIWILLKQETMSGSGIGCKSATRSRQITTPGPHHTVFYRPDALPAAQPTASKHWRHQ